MRHFKRVPLKEPKRRPNRNVQKLLKQMRTNKVAAPRKEKSHVKHSDKSNAPIWNGSAWVPDNRG